MACVCLRMRLSTEQREGEAAGQVAGVRLSSPTADQRDRLPSLPCLPPSTSGVGRSSVFAHHESGGDARTSRVDEYPS